MLFDYEAKIKNAQDEFEEIARQCDAEKKKGRSSSKRRAAGPVGFSR